MFLNKKKFTKKYCSPKKKFIKKLFCTQFFVPQNQILKLWQIQTRIVTKFKNSISDNSISDKTLRQFFFAKNNLTPRQPMRGTLGIVLRFQGVFLWNDNIFWIFYWTINTVDNYYALPVYIYLCLALNDEMSTVRYLN